MLRGPYGLIGSIREAWSRVRREFGPGEVEKRLARRGLVSFRRPPRGWCLVVRASDTRINAATALIVPERAADARDPGEHEVVLDYKLVRRLCAPVSIEPPGEPLRRVAEKLGTTPTNLTAARVRGVFRSNYKRFAGGGSPVPMLYTEKVLDPNGPLFGGDSVWNLACEFLPDLLADGFEQRVVRVPRVVAAERMKSDHHDPPERRSQRLPPAPPDYVWYKWKDGKYVGDEGDRKRAARREAYARNPRRRKRLSVSWGPGRFRGWMFVCPGCRKRVRRLYCPLPPLRLVLGDKSGMKLRACGAGDEASEPLHTFACGQCHEVVRGSLWHHSGWNLFIGHVTGGLLYGDEVPRPDSMGVGRARRYAPRLGCLAPKRRRVLEGVLAGKTVARMAREMEIAVTSVRKHIGILCRQERAADRHELAKKLGSPAAQPLNDVERAAERRPRVVELMREGLRDAEIRARLGISRVELNGDVAWLYRRHGVKGLGQGARGALAEKLGFRCPKTRGEEMRRRVAELRREGKTWREVGRELGLSVSGAKRYAKDVKRGTLGSARVGPDRGSARTSLSRGVKV